jgi:hypothetical protein
VTYKWSAGRYVRTILGCLLFVANMVFIGVELWALLHACKAAPAGTCSVKLPWENIALHAMLLVASWALIHKESLVDVLHDLPLVGGIIQRRPPA